jgi:outer membrane protein TolC
MRFSWIFGWCLLPWPGTAVSAQVPASVEASDHHAFTMAQLSLGSVVVRRAEVVDRSVAADPSLRRAAAARDQVAAQADEARVDFLPRLDLTLSYAGHRNYAHR